MTALAIEIKDLRKHFGKTEIIRGVDLQIKAGERHALIGPNGAGKSTLFHLISGRIPVTSGEILLNGASVVGQEPFQINRKGLSRSFQVPTSLRVCRCSRTSGVRCSGPRATSTRFGSVCRSSRT